MVTVDRDSDVLINPESNIVLASFLALLIVLLDLLSGTVIASEYRYATQTPLRCFSMNFIDLS